MVVSVCDNLKLVKSFKRLHQNDLKRKFANQELSQLLINTLSCMFSRIYAQLVTAFDIENIAGKYIIQKNGWKFLTDFKSWQQQVLHMSTATCNDPFRAPSLSLKLTGFER